MERPVDAAASTTDESIVDTTPSGVRTSLD
jgi:hypothetical protein